MSRLTLWDVVGAAGALSSIVALFLALDSLSVGIGLVLTIGVTTAVVSSFLARQKPLPVVGRDEMIETGNRLVRGAKTKVLMFGGDMSWADDYKDAISSVTDEGKDVEVVYERSQASKVVENANTLNHAGADLSPVEIDCGIRGILVDPGQPMDSVLYIATRSLKEGRPEVKVGRPGKEENYNYVAKVYRYQEDWLLIRTVKKLYDLLTT